MYMLTKVNKFCIKMTLCGSRSTHRYKLDTTLFIATPATL